MFFQSFTVMSQHSSLKASKSVGAKRSVLKRFERVKLMQARGQWKEGRSPIGLPKTKPAV
jgi:small basic protein (TIGR04137 family)